MSRINAASQKLAATLGRPVAALCAVCCSLAIGEAVAADATPMFSADETIQIKIKGPVLELVRKRRQTPTVYPAQLILQGESPEAHAIDLSARGNFRRTSNACEFPPLRVRLDEKPVDSSFFNDQRSLKLVTHCRERSTFQQYLLLEYVTYRLFNVITEASFRVRLADISYVDAESGEEIIQRAGFFIEDIDDLAARLDSKEVEPKSIGRGQLAPDAAAAVTLFHYMVGNLDWSVLKGRDGDDCCHNAKLIGAGKDASSDLTPAPYDFDHAGLVNAPYAEPPDAVNVSSVRVRRFRGFCEMNEETKAAAADFLAKRDALLAVLDETPGLSARTTRKAKAYLEGFFETIEDPKKLERNILKKCR